MSKFKIGSLVEYRGFFLKAQDCRLGIVVDLDLSNNFIVVEYFDTKTRLKYSSDVSNFFIQVLNK